ncbi:MAG: alpha/beta hydrolase family protein, partial [Anaerolineales bacterium]
AFKAENIAEAQDWQHLLRNELINLLGGFPEDTCDLSPRELENRQEDGFACQKVAIQTIEGEYMPCFVLIPPNEAGGSLQPVIALPGHGTWGAEAIVKTPEDPLGAELNQQLNYDYAGQLARRGYMVFVPELRGFGQRLEDPDHREGEAQWISSCYAVGVNALLLGKTLLGLRVYDIMRLIDYIRTRPEPLTESLGCVGLSGGGMATLFTTALDQRITCAVVSGYFNTFRDSIMAIRHCLCNFVPGIIKVAEMVDIARLVAPRPLLIETGTHDPLFPTTATQRAYKELQQTYDIFDADQNLDIDIFEGEHAWSGAKAYDWLAKWT